MPVVALHVHTRYSDGTGTPAEVRAAAAQAGIDVVWITDHDTLAARDDPAVGWRDGRLLLVGAEVTTRAGHLLVLGAPSLTDAGRDGVETARAYRARGAAVFAAHPADRGNRLLGFGPYPWTAGRDALTGLEAWNHLSQWGAARDGLGRLLVRGRRPEAGTRCPDPAALALWDAWSREGPMAAVAGVDAHGIRLGRGRWTVAVLPYAAAFRTVWTQVVLDRPLSGRVADDEQHLTAAVARGRALLVAGSGGRATGFQYEAEGPDGPAPMGSTVPWRPGLTLVARAPTAVEWVWVADGRPVSSERGRASRFVVAHPGVYRVAAGRLGPRGVLPWVYANAIRVVEPSAPG
ncbi:MAG: CehA/McbA family metallohydrolase [Actinomycetia bacterium]|nr:CehA/McbA family metallohydrolase [Actinomycetes bacterium]